MTITSPFLSSLGPALANHLWQSTLFAVAAALLTLALRKHTARARYWLWLAASLKFLFPFSWLIALGTRLSWSHDPVPSSPALYSVVEEIGQPFAQAVQVTTHTPAHASSIFPTLPQAAVVVWLFGFLAVLLTWMFRWLRISAATRRAKALSEGREVAVLRRMERIGGIRQPIRILLSGSSLEPGIFGILRPVLLWPEGISQHLDDANLEAVVAHEVWHVRRRDNLVALIHMLVEAIFWFYPPVWWLGSRLIDERERACDEEVVALGNNRQIYAESILKVCEFCLGSPLPCVSGVAGADLKKRMVHIMNDRILHKLGFARKLLFGTAAVMALAVPITFGLLHATPSQAQSQTANETLPATVYSSVSIKPSAIANGDNRQKMMFSLMDGSFVARGATLERLIEIAYHVQPAQISGAQDFLNKTKFNIEAKLDPSFVAAMPQSTPGKNFDDQNLLKSLLADRFKLVTHPEARTLPAYDLVVDENGSKLQLEASGDEPRMMHLGHGELTTSGSPLELLAAQLSARLGRPVVDKTGLKGTYAFNLHWTPNPTEEERLRQSGEWVAPEPAPDSNSPSLQTALQEQLGLKFVPNTEPVQVLVIDHAEEPAE